VLTTIESDISFETLLSRNSSTFAFYLSPFVIKNILIYFLCVLQVSKLRAFISQSKQVSLHSL